MKYFELIASGIDVKSILAQIDSVPDAWNLSRGRQEKIAVQREAEAIPIRGLVKSRIGDRKRRDVHHSRFTTNARHFPLITRFLEEIAQSRSAQMSRAKVVRLKPGRKVYPHIDRGEYYRLRDRYHLILQSANGSYLKSGDEEVRMQEGELWRFDNKQIHEAFNDGDLDRIHLIFDLLPEHNIAEAGLLETVA